MNVLYACGFSGIVAAVMGFAVFLVVTALATMCRERREEGEGCAWLYGVGMVASLVPLALWVLLAGWDVLPVAIHFGGVILRDGRAARPPVAGRDDRGMNCFPVSLTARRVCSPCSPHTAGLLLYIVLVQEDACGWFLVSG